MMSNGKLITGFVFMMVSLLACADASTITVYRAKPPGPTQSDFSIENAGTTIYSAIGAAESGGVKIAVQDIRSRLVIHNKNADITIISQPTTVLEYTLEQGPSTAKEQYPPLMVWPNPDSGGLYLEPGVDADCKFDDERKTAACVGDLLVPQIQPGAGPWPTSVPEPYPTTYNAELVPVATVTLATGSASQHGSFGAVQCTGIIFVVSLALTLSGALL
ncbi:hypothetical protein CVT24_012346 [Panaeolus cyanescens]|uniref:Uncharacterized protein n=1 Tax=Panaeolus cyanescens TaxID=181874 RepID=A0A409W6B7_9AGAR|nr:hypothetical protein CVT24_012346 [Panaeolus cyanescens]